MINDESGESMKPMEEVPLLRQGESELERLVRTWLMERNRKLIPETRGNMRREGNVDGRASVTKAQ